MKKATESLHFETEKRWRSAQKFDTIDAREDAKMTLGEKISKLRKQQNYTQEQLADILGVSRQAISKWESDLTYPETDKLIALSRLYHCTVDYLLDDNATEPQPQPMSQRNGKTLARALLKYSSSVLFLLWALGLWGLYAVRIFKGMVATNLYVQITCPVMADLQPVLCLLICFAGLATLYGVALTVGKHYFGKTLHTAMTLGCFGFYLAIFVCDMVLLGQIWYFGALRGAFAVVLSVLTCVCAALQVILMLIDGYLSDSIRPAVRKCGTVVKSIGKRLWASRILTLSLTAAIIVCVTLAAVLPATLCNRFRQGVVTRIEIGDSRAKVHKLMGDPLDFSAMADLLASSTETIEIPEDEEDWCTGRGRRDIKEIVRLSALVSDGIKDANFAALAVAKMTALTLHLQNLEMKTVSVYYDGDSVRRLEFDNNALMSREDSVKWNKPGRHKQRIVLSADEFPAGKLPYNVELKYKAYYTDGSFAMGYMENIEAEGDLTSGYSLRWSDIWGEYERFLPAASVPTTDGNGSMVGAIGETYYSLIPEGDGYKLTLAPGGNGGIGGANIDPNIRSRICSVELVPGITEIPDGILEGSNIFGTLELPDTVKRIGKRAFV